MNRWPRRLLLATALGPIASACCAQPGATELQHNPFQRPRPELPAPEPKSPLAVVAAPPQLRLRATLISNRRPLALVEDRVLEIGDEIQGYRLLSVDEGRAVLRGPRGAMKLTVDVETRDDRRE